MVGKTYKYVATGHVRYMKNDMGLYKTGIFEEGILLAEKLSGDSQHLVICARSYDIATMYGR